MAKEAVVLIGHGATASDTPRALIAELKKLESERQARRETAMSPREAELDRRVRDWPRTPENDPYKAGVEEIARALAPRLGGRKLVVAYNEFCAPSVEDAIEALAREGFTRVELVCTMYTRGGVHSEFELPALVESERRKHPGLTIDYAWPFEPAFIAEFLAGQLDRARAGR
ncbi:MAG: CbiX/SirB N-terminal domain-containing protein [Elusimicrobia bacterium]|nr:CbiX/SirB N-terminal domain-containing protein [Elusimicrobiota bacterium]